MAINLALLVCAVQVWAEVPESVSGRLLYEQWDGDVPNIYLLDLDNSTTTLLAEGAARIALSPDKSHFAYTRRLSSTDYEIRTMGVDGKDDRHVYYYTSQWGGDWIQWTPSGQRIIFRRQAVTCVAPIYSVRLDGSDEKMFLDPIIADGNDRGVYGLCYSPDYETVTWSSQDGCWSPTLQLYRAPMINDEIDASNVVQLTYNNVYDDLNNCNAFAGGKMTFWRAVGATYGLNYFEVFVANDDGSEAVQVTSNSYTDNRSLLSPDASNVVWATRPNGDPDIMGMDLSTGEKYTILSTPNDEGPIAWLPPLPCESKISGTSVLACNGTNSANYGVEVDLYSSATGDLLETVITEEDGYFEFGGLCEGQYVVSAVTPLGQSAVVVDHLVDADGACEYNIKLVFECIPGIGEERGIGFWKHQVAVANGGPGRAQIDGNTLCSYLDMIADHFNSNAINQVVVYELPSSELCEDKLQVAKELLNLHGQQEMVTRARQHFMAALLNVAAGYLALHDVASDDGATVSQAITYCDNLIDDPQGDHELAKDIAESLNNGRLVGTGVIPLDTVNIAYRIPSANSSGYVLQQNEPNPFNPATKISYAIPGDGHVSLVIYSLNGHAVRTLVSEYQPKGSYQVIWNGTNEEGRRVASGTYLYRLKSGQFEDLRKMTLVK